MMLSRINGCLRQFFTKPLFGTRVLPKDAVVDPALFSEKEFPVRCTKCAYLLRALADGPCPECGTPFRRGRLLVRQYVQQWQGPIWQVTAAGRWSRRLFWIGLALILLSSIGFGSLKYLLPAGQPPATPAQVSSGIRFVVILLAVEVVGFAMVFVSGVMTIWTYPRNARKKRRAIINAIFAPRDKH